MKNLPGSFFFLFAICSILISCSAYNETSVPRSFPVFYKEGHRGTRGLMPENTIPAMKKGIEAGANVIEVDVYTSKDGKVIITHDPYVNADHSLTAEGKELTREDGKKFVFHQMNYSDIRKFDVGSKHNNGYPQQKNIPAYIPLLSELIDSVELYITTHKLPEVIYNIELKSSEKYDNTYNSLPNDLVEAVMEVLKSKKLGPDRFYLQSFDVRPLQYIKKKYPKVSVGFLTDSKNTFEQNIQELGFTPHFYSPQYSLVTPELVKKVHAKSGRLVPWTVNTEEKVTELVQMGVDGVITDYPNLLQDIKK